MPNAQSPALKRKPITDRAHHIRLIKMGQQQIGWDDATYRAQLESLTGKRSATEMSDAEHSKVIEHLQAHGAMLKWSKRRATQVTDAKKPQISLIRVLLTQLGNYGDNYADSISRRMFKVDRYEWLDSKRLTAIITALNVQLAKVRARAA